MVFSRGCFFGVVEVAEGRTTVAAFFGLSSSLKENYSSSREREGQKKENLEKIHLRVK
jgi:hypothetical protein